MTGLREVALRIHSLEEGDRRWLLDQLGAEERAKLGNYIDELQQIGLQTGTELFDIDDLLVRGADPGTGAGDGEDSPQTVNALSAEAVYQTLVLEPDWIVAAVLGQHDWRWTESVLNKIGGKRAKRLCELAQGIDMAGKHRIGKSIVNQLAGKFPHSQDNTGSVSRFENLLSKLQSDDIGVN